MRSGFAFVVGMTFLALPGCMYHSGYYPNGYYGPGPSVLPSQPWTGAPSGPIFQPGGPPVFQPVVPNQPGNSPTPLNGGNPYVPGTSPGTSGPTYGDPGAGSAPPFNSNPGNAGGNSVPNPDDGFDRQPGAQRPVLSPTTSSKAADDLIEQVGQQKSGRRPRTFEDSSSFDADSAFETPVIQTSNTSENEVRYADDQEQVERVPVSNKKFANDQRFAWVQGVVEYDEASSTWVIMYNDNPRTSDVYGGVLTLADDPELKRLQTDKVFRIYGTLDPSERDSRGTPVYRVTRIEGRSSAVK